MPRKEMFKKKSAGDLIREKDWNDVASAAAMASSTSGNGRVGVLVNGAGTFTRGIPERLFIEGFLDASLGESSCKGEIEATANMTVYKGKGDRWSSSNGPTRVVTNRDDSLSANSGDYVICIRINGEWRPIWVSCDVPTSSGASC